MNEAYKKYLHDISCKINRLTIYKGIAKDPAVRIIKEICVMNNLERNISELAVILIENAEKYGLKGNIFKSHILNLFRYDENIFSLYCENNADIKNTSLYNLALNDVKIIKALTDFNLNGLKEENPIIEEITDYQPVHAKENKFISDISEISDEKTFLSSFIKFYNTAGCGVISLYRAFKYDDKKGLTGIPKPDPITFDDIIGYKTQTDTLIKNTEAFLNGYGANNVLLVGSRGTGKSSSVKALANKYFDAGLRLIEITKEQILMLPALLSILKERGRRFIIFIDDLSFDEQEIQYKYMKSLLDGGSENKPENVLFYATSNRRHLIQERWSDRQRGSEDAEIHTQDTLNE